MKEHKWQKLKDYQEKKTNYEIIHNEEQELHLNLNKEDRICYVSCSWYSYILKLSQNPNFTISEAIISPLGKYLQVKGSLPLNKVTLRKK